jgi:hypothetical protein
MTGGLAKHSYNREAKGKPPSAEAQLDMSTVYKRQRKSPLEIYPEEFAEIDVGVGGCRIS